MEPRATRFIGEEVEVVFGDGARFEKRPPCPETIVWRGTTLRIAECVEEWKDYARRGKMAHNMREPHLATAEKRGSWGVGRHYFRVRCEDGRVFDLYYDRAPKGAAEKKGSWHLLRQMASESG